MTRTPASMGEERPVGLIDVVRDWTQVKKQKEGLLDALRQTPPGAGISVKDPGNPITARAIIELLKEYPNELEATDFGFEVTILRKAAMVRSMNAESYKDLRSKHGILSADSVMELGLANGSRLPAHKFRDGIPDDVNDGPTAVGNVIVEPGTK